MLLIGYKVQGVHGTGTIINDTELEGGSRRIDIEYIDGYKESHVYTDEDAAINALKLSKIYNVKPDHYRGEVEPLDLILAQNLGFCEGNIIKYVARYKRKNGIEDLKKAEYYLKKLIEKESAK